ncbi:hypothetical protein KY290_038355 [Solanum tuberosum]|uniref:Uncharacterized protein n=1 Tax=Solanum tuberosum TaxID=4113 RepID=A0ABQ7TYV0_SOLTU|nr:hypothetical protein KY284_036189 [Solanum tuberosum]KAH0739650.1 hypothetical protein KY290_038355 [Solanum tuberosum]
MEGLQLWLQKWTPDFEIGIGHPYCTSVAMDVATNGRTRPSMSKVQVEIDLVKSHLDNVWMGLEDEEPLRGYYQKA